MSRFSAEPLRLTLKADAWQLQSADGAHAAALAGDPALALEALPPISALRKAGRLVVELGDIWLRYLVVQWPTGLRGARERRLWLEARFRAVHDIGPEAWCIAIDRDACGDSTLACAAPRAIVEALQVWIQHHRLRLTAFSGAYVHAYNRIATQAAGGRGAFALCRDGRLTTGSWQDGQWLRVRSEPSGTIPSQTLARTLALWSAGEPAALPGRLHVEGLQAEALPAGWSLAANGVGV